MKRTKKRRPDFRKIRPTKTYSSKQIAKALDRTVPTVHKWIRDGLPILEGDGQKLILGSDLKLWLREKWDSKRQKNGAGEMRCFTCVGPSLPEIGSVRIVPRNEKLVDIKAKCSKCGAQMSVFGSRAKIAEIENEFRSFLHHTQRIVGYSEPIDKQIIGEAIVNGHIVHPNEAVDVSQSIPDFREKLDNLNVYPNTKPN